MLTDGWCPSAAHLRAQTRCREPETARSGEGEGAGEGEGEGGGEGEGRGRGRGSSVPRGLKLEEFCIFASLFEQFLVGAGCLHAAVGENQDAIRHSHAGEPM
jgi:hypothetical protein